MIVSDEQVERVMRSTGFDREAVLNHLLARERAQAALNRRRLLPVPAQETQAELVDRRGREFYARHADHVVNIEQAKRNGSAVASPFSVSTSEYFSRW